MISSRYKISSLAFKKKRFYLTKIIFRHQTLLYLPTIINVQLNLKKVFNLKFYKVGMISLLFIPAICIPYLKVEYKKRDFRLLKLNMPAPAYGKGISYDYSMLDKVRKEAVLKDLDYNDPKLEEKIHEFSKLDSNQAFLEKISVDYQYGYRVRLSNLTSYETLVKLISTCQKYKLTRYALDLRYNEMYIYDIFNRPKSNEKIIGCVFDNFVICSLDINKSFSQKMAETFNHYITPITKSFNKTIGIYIGFMALVFVAYRNRIKSI